MPWTQVGQRFGGRPAAVQWEDTARSRVVVSVFARLADSSQLGYLELHVEGSRPDDRRLVLREPSGTWQVLPEVIRGNPAVLDSPSPALRVFVRGTDGMLWLRWSNGTSWFGPEQVPDGVFASGMSVVEDELGLLHVFVRGLDTDSTRGAVWFAAQPTPIERVPDLRWGTIGGDITGNPQAVAFPSLRRLHVYVRGLDGRLWRAVRADGAWTDWQSLGQPVADDPAVVKVRSTSGAAEERAYVVYREPGGRIRYLSVPGVEVQPSRIFLPQHDELVGDGFGAPAVATRTPYAVDVVARSATGEVMWSSGSFGTEHGRFAPWQSLGASFPFDPVVVGGRFGTLHVFAMDRDGTLYHTWHDGARWR